MEPGGQIDAVQTDGLRRCSGRLVFYCSDLPVSPCHAIDAVRPISMRPLRGRACCCRTRCRNDCRRGIRPQANCKCVNSNSERRSTSCSRALREPIQPRWMRTSWTFPTRSAEASTARTPDAPTHFHGASIDLRQQVGQANNKKASAPKRGGSSTQADLIQVNRLTATCSRHRR